jgi:hypothetical protein
MIETRFKIESEICPSRVLLCDMPLLPTPDGDHMHTSVDDASAPYYGL